MNHIYRTIWKQISNTFVAVSELSKAQGKKNNTSCTTPSEPSTPRRSRLGFTALEPRVMFDGAMVSTIDAQLDTLEPTSQSPSSQAALSESSSQAESSSVDASTNELTIRSGTPDSPTQITAEQDIGELSFLRADVSSQAASLAAPAVRDRVELVFIENNVADFNTLMANIGPGREVHVLDATQDGLAQIADILGGRSDVDALHILSHGRDGGIDFGSLKLDSNTLSNHTEALQTIGSALKQDADILLYGCNIAQTEQGRGLVEQLALVTGADVAASNNVTGSAALGGDWELEIMHGSVETASVVTPAMTDLYESVLAISSATVTFATGANFVNKGGDYNTTADVVYKVNGDASYKLVINGNDLGVQGGYGAYAALSPGANNLTRESLVTLSFQDGQTFDITSVSLDNSASNAQTLEFNAFDSKGAPVGSTQTANLISSSNSVSFTGFTGISTLKITATTNSGAIHFVNLDDIVLANITSADSTPPSLNSVTLSDSAITVGETATVTFTFSEALDTNTFTSADVTVGSGAISSLSSADGGTTWTATYTPTASVEDSSNVISVDVSGVKDAAGNAGSGTKSSSNYTVDTLRPTATITVTDTTLLASETSAVTITFSEAVDSFDNSDLTIANGTLSTVSSSDGGTTWTATLTPDTSVEDASNVITLGNTGVTDKAGNAGTGSTDSNNYAVETLLPTATISVTDTSLIVGETSAVTITFSEAVDNFDNSDLTIANGTLSTVSSSDGGTTWTATLTPTASTEDASNVITLANTGVTDKAGNAGSGTTDSNNYAIDTLAPSAPSTPDLTPATDVGASKTDNITATIDIANGNTAVLPSFIGTGTVGTTVYVYDGATEVGQLTLTSSKWLITSATQFSAGVHTLTAKAVDAAGNISAASSSLTVTVVDPTAPPTISSVAYNERAGTLTVKGSNFVALTGSANDIDVTKLTFTGEGGTTYTLTADTANVELTSSTEFTVNVGSTDQASLQQILNNNSTKSFSGTTYQMAAAEDWNAGTAGTAVTDASGKAVTVSGIATISSASYTAHGSGPIAAGTLTVTGTNMNTGSDTIDPTKLTLQVLNGATVIDSYTLTTAYNPATTTIDSTTQFSVVLNATDQLFINGLLNNAGTTSIDGYDFNLNAAAGWNTSFTYAPDKYVSTPALTNSVNVDDAAAPTVTSATFNTISHVLTVTGTDMVAFSGSDNDVQISYLTITGAGGKTYTLTSSDVDVTSATSFAVTLNSTDQTGLAALLDKDGTKAGDNTTYNVSAALNWNGQVATVADTTNALTVITPAPAVSKVIQTSGDASYKIGDTVSFKVSFDQAVVVDDSGGTPRILLETGTTDQYAIYISGSGSADLIFSYIVQTGDTSSDLQYFDTASFDLNSGTIVSVANGSTADLTLPGTGTVLSLAGSSAVVIDGVAPSAPSTPDLDAGSDSGSSNSDDYTSDNTPTFNGTAEANSTVYLYDTDGATQLGSATADGSGNWSITASSMADGSHTVTTKAQDAAGNISSASSGLTVTIDTTAPTTTVSTVTFSDDTGSSSTDFITSTAKQDISGTLSANLAANESVQVSFDNGSTWSDANTTVGQNTFTLSKQTLSGTDTMKVRVVNLAGNAGSSKSQSYTIDSTAPTTPSAPDLATVDDDGTSNSDNKTSVHQPHVTGTAEAGTTIYLYDTDGITVLGSATVDGSGNYDIVPTSALTDGIHTLTVKAIDTAGNESIASKSLDVTIRTAPNQTVTDVVFSADTGISATDFITATAAQDISGTLSSALLSGQSVEISLDNGTTWVQATSTGSKDTFNLTGQTLTSSDTMKVRVSDDVGNFGAIRSDAYIYDTTGPGTLTVKMSTSSLKVGSTATATFTFDEAVGNFDNNDITVANGTLSTVSSKDGGITWTGTFTPTDGITDATNVISVDKSTLTDLAGNAGTGTTNSSNYKIDTVRPTVTISMSDTALKVGETSTVKFTFSEAVSGFTNADLLIDNGTLSSVSSSDGGTTWTATFTPSADTEDTSNVITINLAGLSDFFGNAGSSTDQSSNYTIDTLRPTVSISMDDSKLGVGETALVTFTFSEAVSGFTTADILADNGTVSGLNSSDGGVTWTATFTPDKGVTSATNVITVDNTGVTDAAGNAGTSTTDSPNYEIDQTAPTPTVTLDSNSLKAGDTATVTISFNEAVTGLTTADLTIANGTVSNLSSSNGGSTWSGTFTPSANVESATNVITLDNTGIADAFGNAGTGTTDSNNYAIDTKRPTATISLDDTAIKIGDTAKVTLTFSEAISGLTNADLTIANGTLSTVASSDGGTTWTAIFTPSNNIDDASNVITLDNTGVADLAGNAGSGTTDSNNYAIDSKRPTATLTLNDSKLSATDTPTVTITFSEAVSGLTAADLTVSNGVVSGLSTSDGGLTWTSTLTPNSSVENASNVITLDNTGVVDAAGNAGSGSMSSGNYAIDTKRPTATITLDDTALKIGDTAKVTLTFSEAVSGLTNADLTIANGTLSTVSSADGGTTWTATFTPSASVENATNVITLDNTGIADAFGNAGTGSTNSGNYAVDTLAATVSSIAISSTTGLQNNRLNAGDVVNITANMSQATTVSGSPTLSLNIGDTIVQADYISGSGSSALVFSYTIPAGYTDVNGISIDANSLSLNGGSLQDTASNNAILTHAALTDQAGYMVDTTAPAAPSTLALSANSDSNVVGDGVTKINTPVITGTAEADATVMLYDTDGTSLLGTTQADGAGNWSITSSTLIDGTHTFTAKAIDLAGNIGASSSELTIMVDTILPNISGAVATQAVNDNASLTPFATMVIADASIPTQEQTVSITLDNATKGSLSNLSGGSYNSITGVYSITGTPSVITSAVQGLIFTPTPNHVTPTNTETTTFTVLVTDKAGNSGNNTASSVVSTSINDIPTLAQITAVSYVDTTINDNFTTITGTLVGTDVDTSATLRYGIQGQSAVGTVTHTQSGSYGTLSVTVATGAWIYVPNAAAINAVPSGSISESFNVFVWDGIASSIQTLVINVTAANDTPVLATPTAANYTDTGTNDSFSPNTGTLLGSDRDSNTTLTYGIQNGVVANGSSSLVGNYGSLSVNTSTGAYTYTPNANTINALSGNATDSFTVTVHDGSATTSATYSVNLTGSNDVPTLNPITAVAYVDTAINDSFTSTSGTLSGADRDSGTTLLYGIQGQSAVGAVSHTRTGSYGTLTVNVATGAWSYTPNAAAINAVRSGMVSESFNLFVWDGIASTLQPLAINITAANDTPVLDTPAAASYIDTNANDSFSNNTGTLTGSDRDNASTLTYGISGGTVNAGISTLQGSFGSLSVNTSTGTYTYTPNATAINGLSSNASDSFTVTVNDGMVTTQAIYSANITAANDTPILSTPANASYTDTAAFDVFSNHSGTLVASDRDTGSTLTYGISGGTVNAGISTLQGNFGSLSVNISTGAYSYTPNAALINGLSNNSSDNFTVTVSDGSLISQANYLVNIVGVNDLPTLATINPVIYLDTAQNDRFAVADGMLIGNDRDAGTSLLYGIQGQSAVGAVTHSQIGSYGTLSVTVATGAWSYTPNANAIQALKTGPVSESFNLFVWDGSASTIQPLRVDINATNDTPVLATPNIAHYIDSSTDDRFSNDTGLLQGSDRDSNTTLSYGIDGGTVSGLGISSLNGNYGELSVNISTGAYTFVPNAVAINALSNDASESFTINVSDGVLSSRVSYTVSISATNDTPTLTPPAAVNYTDTVDNDDFVIQTGTLTGFDRDSGTTLTYSVSGGSPLGSSSSNYGTFSINRNTGAYSYVPNSQAINALRALASESFTVTVSDGSHSSNAIYQVNFNGGNDRPQFTSQAVINASEDHVYSYQISTSDIDTGDSRSISAVTKPAWLTLQDQGNGNASLTGTPLNEHVGSHNVTLLVTDANGASTTQSFTILVTNTNDAPQIDTNLLPLAMITAGQSGSIVLPAGLFTDMDLGDQLTIRLENSDGSAVPSWISFDANNRRIDLAPSFAINGSFRLTLIASDQTGAQIDGTMIITVIPFTPAVVLSSDTPTSNSPNTISSGTIPDSITVIRNAETSSGTTTDSGLGTTGGLGGGLGSTLTTGLGASLSGDLGGAGLSGGTGLGGGGFGGITSGGNGGFGGFGSNGGNGGALGGGFSGSGGNGATFGGGLTGSGGSSALGGTGAGQGGTGGASSSGTTGGDTSNGGPITAPALNNSPNSVVTFVSSGVATTTSSPSLVLATPAPDIQLQVGNPLSINLPAGTFQHTNPAAQVSLSAQRVDGAALPGWLKFDTSSGQFSGTPPSQFSGTLVIKVIARDNQGNEAVTTFKIEVGRDTPSNRPQDSGPRSSLPTERTFGDKLKGRSSLAEQLAQQGRQQGELKRQAFLDKINQRINHTL